MDLEGGGGRASEAAVLVGGYGEEGREEVWGGGCDGEEGVAGGLGQEWKEGGGCVYAVVVEVEVGVWGFAGT